MSGEFEDSYFEASPQTPLNTIENNILALKDKTTELSHFFRCFIEIYYQARQFIQIPPSAKARSLCQALYKAVQKYNPSLETEITYRATPHTLIIDYIIAETLTISTRLEILPREISTTFNFKNLITKDLLIPHIYHHLELLEQNNQQILKNIPKIYIFLLKAEQTEPN